jgi:hypothetical protein
MKLNMLLGCVLSVPLVSCQSVPVDPNKKLERFKPVEANIVVSESPVEGGYFLTEDYDHEFDVVRHEALIDVDFATADSMSPFEPAPYSEFNYWNEKFVDAELVPGKGVELMPNNFTNNPLKNQFLWGAGMQVYLDNSVYQAYEVKVAGKVVNQSECEVSPIIFFNEQQDDYQLVSEDCIDGQFSKTYRLLAKGDVSRLLILSGARNVDNVELLRSVLIESVKVEGLSFVKHPMAESLEVLIQATNTYCDFGLVSGSVDIDFDEGGVFGYLSSGAQQYRFKGVIDKKLNISFRLSEVGGVNHSNHSFPLTWLNGSYEEVRSRTGCSFTVEVKPYGYYGDLFYPVDF